MWQTTWKNYLMDLASIPTYEPKTGDDEPIMIDEADEISSLKALGF